MALYKGLDLLGLAMMDIRMLERELQHGTAIGTLMGTFGNPLPNLQRILNAIEVPLVRIHLTSGVGERNGVAEKGRDPAADDFKTLRERAEAVAALKAKHPRTQFWVSYRLEHDVRNAQLVKDAYNAIGQVSRQLLLVQNPFSGMIIPGGIIIERHGNSARGGFISSDGASSSDARHTLLDNGSHAAFLWLHSFNGRGPGDDGFVPPSKRKKAWFCDELDIRYCNQWIFNGMETRPAAGKRRLVQAPEIYKPYSEYYSQQSDPRERKPVLLSKLSVRKFDVVSRGGKVIGEFQHYPGKVNGLNRYYSNLHSTEIVRRNGGFQWVTLRAGSRSLLVNAIFRQGTFRDE